MKDFQDNPDLRQRKFTPMDDRYARLLDDEIESGDFVNLDDDEYVLYALGGAGRDTITKIEGSLVALQIAEQFVVAYAPLSRANNWKGALTFALGRSSRVHEEEWSATVAEFGPMVETTFTQAWKRLLAISPRAAARQRLTTLVALPLQPQAAFACCVITLAVLWMGYIPKTPVQSNFNANPTLSLHPKGVNPGPDPVIGDPLANVVEFMSPSENAPIAEFYANRRDRLYQKVLKTRADHAPENPFIDLWLGETMIKHGQLSHVPSEVRDGRKYIDLAVKAK